jgi:hypothetical protein
LKWALESPTERALLRAICQGPRPLPAVLRNSPETPSAMSAARRRTADYNDMIYATTPEEIAVRRKAFIRKWRLKHRAVTDSLDEAGRPLVHLRAHAAEPMAQPAHHQRYRAFARGVQATDQDPNRSTVSRHRCDVVLGAAGLRTDQHAQGRWLADPRHKTNRSADRPCCLKRYFHVPGECAKPNSNRIPDGTCFARGPVASMERRPYSFAHEQSSELLCLISRLPG